MAFIRELFKTLRRFGKHFGFHPEDGNHNIFPNVVKPSVDAVYDRKSKLR